MTKISGLEGIGKWSDWLFRFRSFNFVIIVNKHTGEYKNIYYHGIHDRIVFEHLELMLDKHPNFED